MLPVLSHGFGAQGGSTPLTKVLVQLPIWQNQQQAAAHRHCLAAPRAIERGSMEIFVLT
jgi:hypothetical protein